MVNYHVQLLLAIHDDGLVDSDHVDLRVDLTTGQSCHKLINAAIETRSHFEGNSAQYHEIGNFLKEKVELS